MNYAHVLASRLYIIKSTLESIVHRELSRRHELTSNLYVDFFNLNRLPFRRFRFNKIKGNERAQGNANEKRL